MGILDSVIERVIYPRGTTKIIAGTNLRDGPGIERDLIKVFIPAEYDVHVNHHAEILVAEADIAVGELSADLGVHQHPDRLVIIPMEVLDPHSNAGVNERAKFCGFGYDILIQHAGQFHPGESNNNINKFMDVKILGRDECPQFNTDICARNSDKRTFRTACYGDSGAELVYGNKIVGVHSSGPAHCNTIEPIVFTRLYGFMRFIEEAQNPDGDHSNMMILDAKPARRRPQAGSSSSSTRDKKRKIELKAKNAQHYT